MPVAQTSFESEFASAFDAVRAALIELYGSVDADPYGPQEVSRRFGVNKTLAWNVSKVMTGRDALASIPNLPGLQAFELLLSAIEKGGADHEIIGRTRHAIERLDETVTRHAGDRATLGLIVDGMSPGRSDHLASSRKLAFRGNSGLLGVQATARLMTVFLAPNPDDPARIDFAIVRGFVGLRRLRSEVRWPIFHVRGWGHGPDMTTEEIWQPLDDATDRDGTAEGAGGGGGGSKSLLLRRFSTVSDTDLEIETNAAGTNYLLAPGPIGNAGSVECYLADAGRAAAPRYRCGADRTGEFGATISAPTERLIFDLIVDERLDFALDADVRAVLGLFTVQLPETLPVGELPLLVPDRIDALPGTPPAVATPAVPQYPAIVKFVNERMGWNPASFRGCRYELSHPPLGSTILLRFELPEAPGGA